MKNNHLAITTLGKPEKWLIKAAREMGLDIASLVHETTNYFENHSLNRHGDRESEEKQGQVAITREDLKAIPEIIKSPDYAIIGIKRHGETVIAYGKHFNGNTILYLENVLDSRKNKSLRSMTMFKKRGFVDKETFIKIISNNAHTDISHIKIVVGAGGNPGEEAV